MWLQTVFHRMLCTSHRIYIPSSPLGKRWITAVWQWHLLRGWVSHQHLRAFRTQNSTLRRWYRCNLNRKLEPWVHSPMDFRLEWPSSRQKGPVTSEDTGSLSPPESRCPNEWAIWILQKNLGSNQCCRREAEWQGEFLPESTLTLLI